jgi:site-specific DNA recombinase
VSQLRCAAIYARVSTEMQSRASIDDQIRKCRQYAEVHGLKVLEEHIYRDQALSGVGADRPALKRILQLSLSVAPPFTAILVDDTSRLSRITEDALSIFKRLNFAGIQLIAVSQGISSDDEQSEMLVTMHGLMDSQYVRELAKKTHRGMEGLALRGLHTGGRIFGYNTISIGEGSEKKLVVNPSEATIVKRIFELSAGGQSLKAITRTLNAEHVPCPRPREDRVGGQWCHTAIREMLKNELYIGNVVWNRSKFVKVPGTNKRQRRPRPESEWLRASNHDLAIVSPDLWSAVRTRFAALPEIWGYPKSRGLVPRAMTSPYLFSGLLKCSECGANLIIATGGGTHRHKKYACSRRFNNRGCENDLYIRRDELEDLLLGKLHSELLQPEVVDYAVVEFQQQLEEALSSMADDLGEMRQRKTRLEAEVRRLVSAVAEVGHSRSLLEEIGRKEAELQGIADRLLSATPASIDSQIAEIRSFVRSGMSDLRLLLRKDTALARAELLKHSREIIMRPDLKRRFYVADGTWDLLGDGWTEATSHSTGGFGWLRGPDLNRRRSLVTTFPLDVVWSALTFYRQARFCLE